MPDTTQKVDTNTLPQKQSGSSSLSPSMHGFLWNTANFTTVAGLTNLAIISVQSPVKTLLLNFARTQNFIPTHVGGTLGLFRALYAGTQASITGSAVRTVYVTGAKNNKPIEGITNENLVREENIQKMHRIKFSYVMFAAMGDILVTQVPESLSQLKKIPGLLPNDFKWYTPHNMQKLMANGITARYATGLINFTAMLQLESAIANQLSIEDKTIRHATAGALSGSLSACVSYPLATLKDLTLARTTMTSNGQLVNERSLYVMKDLYADLVKDPKQTAKLVMVNAGKQLPLRMGLSGLIFSIIAGMGEMLGVEPLKKVVPTQYQPVAKNPQSFFAPPVEKESTSAEKTAEPQKPAP